MKCKFIDFESADWKHLDGFEDRTVFQTREWVRFVAQCQKAVPVLAELRDGSDIVGYFTGLTFSRFGVRVLGSSFPGWTTPYMGFNLIRGASRATALRALETSVWDELKCLHMEISDPNFVDDDGRSLGFQCESYTSYRTDLTKSEDEIFNRMDSACRRCVRKAEKSGVTIEEAHDLVFADEYYEQLKDVFAQAGTGPHLQRGTGPVAHSASRTDGPYPAGARARCARKVHRLGDFSRIQQNRGVLGQC
jgi:hypothetical protein